MCIAAMISKKHCLKRIQTTHMSYKITIDHRDFNTSTVISNIPSIRFVNKKKTNLKLQIKVKNSLD